MLSLALLSLLGTAHVPAAALGRRALLRGAATAGLGSLGVGLAPPASAIVRGADVADAEAAATGAVGLYIDLTGCTVCRKGVPATCTGTLVAPDLVLSARHCTDVPFKDVESVFLLSRFYLEPDTATAPDPATLVKPNILHYTFPPGAPASPLRGGRWVQLE